MGTTACYTFAVFTFRVQMPKAQGTTDKLIALANKLRDKLKENRVELTAELSEALGAIDQKKVSGAEWKMPEEEIPEEVPIAREPRSPATPVLHAPAQQDEDSVTDVGPPKKLRLSERLKVTMSH